jgi:hypothetical protein
MLTTTVIHCNVAVCTMTVIVCYTMPAVMRSRGWSMMLSRSVVMSCGLVHVGIV